MANFLLDRWYEKAICNILAQHRISLNQEDETAFEAVLSDIRAQQGLSTSIGFQIRIVDQFERRLQILEDSEKRLIPEILLASMICAEKIEYDDTVKNIEYTSLAFKCFDLIENKRSHDLTSKALEKIERVHLKKLDYCLEYRPTPPDLDQQTISLPLFMRGIDPATKSTENSFDFLNDFRIFDILHQPYLSIVNMLQDLITIRHDIQHAENNSSNINSAWNLDNAIEELRILVEKLESQESHLTAGSTEKSSEADELNDAIDELSKVAAIMEEAISQSKFLKRYQEITNLQFNHANQRTKQLIEFSRENSTLVEKQFTFDDQLQSEEHQELIKRSLPLESSRIPEKSVEDFRVFSRNANNKFLRDPKRMSLINACENLKELIPTLDDTQASAPEPISTEQIKDAVIKIKINVERYLSRVYLPIENDFNQSVPAETSAEVVTAQPPIQTSESEASSPENNNALTDRIALLLSNCVNDAEDFRVIEKIPSSPVVAGVIQAEKSRQSLRMSDTRSASPTTASSMSISSSSSADSLSTEPPSPRKSENVKKPGTSLRRISLFDSPSTLLGNSTNLPVFPNDSFTEIPLTSPTLK